MSVLSALLARDRVVSPQKIDEAIQRQVINGGDFETNLLEVGAVPEDTLSGYCAAVHDAHPISRDEIAAASLSALARLEKTSAESLRIVPVRIDAGRMLVAAVAPLSAENRAMAEAEIGAPLDVRITTPFRLSWALWKFYGSELSPRLQRLAGRLGQSASGQMRAVSSPPSVPPPVAGPTVAPQNKLRPSVLAALSAALSDERDSVMPDSPHEAGPAVSTTLTDKLAAALTAVGPSPADSSGRFSVPPATSNGIAPPAATPAAPSTVGHDALTHAKAEAAAQPVPVAPAPPPTLEQAIARIAAAADRDAITDALLDYAAGHVAYAAVFVVHGDVAEGLDARGDGLDSEHVRGIAVPLDAPGSFRAVRERGEPIIGVLNTSGTDAVIKQDLGRTAVTTVALLPIHIAGRASLIVWSDDGTQALDLKAIDGIGKLCGEAARAFEKIIRERKKRRMASDTAAAAAAAIATGSMSPVTPADIQRRFAEQRGAQALKKLATTAPAETTVAREAPPELAVTQPAPVTASSDETTPTPTMPSNAPRPMTSPAVTREDHTVETRRARPSERPPESTRFARGGRVPISVDVIGPLPNPASLPSEMNRAARPHDPRREPDEADAPTATDETARLLSEVVRTGQLSDRTANELLGAGERALAAVFRYFPGPTQVDRSNTRARLPAVAEIGPLLRLVVMFRQSSGPHLVEQLESYDAERRYFATLCLAEVVYAPALPSIITRLYDTDYPTAVVAIEALRAYRKVPNYDESLAILRATVSDPNSPSDRRRTAANVLGELRDVEAIPSLLVALQDRDGALAGISRRALVTLSRQDFGQDAGAWEAWWSEASAMHRVEWLIEALLHQDAALRHDASEELKKLTGQFFGYYFNLPRRERERAHGRYLDWWQREGKLRLR